MPRDTGTQNRSGITSNRRARMNAAAVGERDRVPALTGVRFCAAMLVFLSHAGLPAPFDWFALSGYNGVTLFFVLSGFVLTLNYFEELTRPTPRKLWNFG